MSQILTVSLRVAQAFGDLFFSPDDIEEQIRATSVYASTL